MNKTKIDWATMSWNPVTGCRHGCPYCYARRTAHRFDAGCVDHDPLADGLHVLEEKIKATPYPYGFEPTMHRYRLNQPERQAEPQTVFVCSMADLFGRWVPTSWIAEVLDACRRAPQHRYLFLTKNPARYLQLDYMGLLPHENNFWYGSTVANEDAAAMYTMQGVAINSFWSMEPLLGPGGHERGGGPAPVGDPGGRNREPGGQGGTAAGVGGPDHTILRGERNPGFLQGQPAGAFPGSPALCLTVG